MNAVKKTVAKSPAKKTAPKADTTAKSLAALLREKRMEAGYDIESLATHALISSKVVHLLETKPQTVPLHDLYAVANVLNLDPGVVLELLHSAATSAD